MRYLQHIIPCLLIALLLSGCVPGERFWWSPDGSKAVVVVGNELRIVNQNGETVFVPEVDGSGITESVAWLPDGQSFLAHRRVEFASWEDARMAFPEAASRKIEELAATVPAIVEATVTLGGDTDSIDVLLDRVDTREPDFLRNAFYLQWERNPASIRAHLDSTPRLRKKLGESPAEHGRFYFHRIELVGEKKASETLVESVLLLSPPHFSPVGNSIVYGRRTGDKAFVDLVIRRADRSEVVAKRVYPAYAWDSKSSLIAVAPVAHSESMLKQVKRYHFPEGKETSTELLATVLMPFSPRVAFLPDRSLLFASQNGTLPVSQSDMIPEGALYRWLPDTRELLRVPTAKGALPMNLGYFVASPDGERVAVVESDTDAVAVVEVATGEVKIVSPPHPGAKCRTLPAWRSGRELSFARLDADANKVEWVLWNADGGTSVINGNWPRDYTEEWIEIKTKATE